jgi:hypothetical protein
MIIYNKTWLENLHVRKQANTWFRQHFISKEEKEKIDQTHEVGFYAPSFLMSLGLFFFTSILISSASGFITFFIASSGMTEEIGFQIIGFLLGISCLFMAENYKQKEHFYHTGTDNALVWAGCGFIIGNVFWMLVGSESSGEISLTVGFLFSFLVCSLATVRYADILAAISAFICWFLFLFFFCGHFGDLVKAILPFISFVNAIGFYLLAKKWNTSKIKIYWGPCMAIIEASALLMAYISVNYFVVREMSAMMFELALAEGEDIPFAALFYFFTFAIPVFYIFWGLKTKDRLMLRMALLLVVVSILTIRHYYSILPIETAMAIGGFILLGISYFLIRYLHTPKFGLTYQNEEEGNRLLNLEGILIAQTFGGTHKPNTDPNFGGGGFGGGGANGGF